MRAAPVWGAAASLALVRGAVKSRRMSKATEIKLMPKETEVNRIIYVTLAIVYAYIVSAGIAVYQLF